MRLRYRNPPLEHDTILFAITQSGETADTLAALRELKRKGHSTLSICNVVGSTIAQESEGGIYLHAGPEIGVASTKAYTSQLMVLGLLALHIGRLRDLSYEAGSRIIRGFQSLPDKIEEALGTNDDVRRIAGKYLPRRQFLVSWPAIQFSDCPGRRIEAEGNQLHPCRRISSGGNETWSHRAS